MRKSTLIKGHELGRYLKIRELVKEYPNDMEFGSKVRELFLDDDACKHGNSLNSNCSDCDEEEMDTAGYPIKKISKYLTTDIDEVVMIDE